MIAIERWQEIAGGHSGGTFKERSSTLEQTGSLFVKDRADSTVGQEELGVELLSQLGLKEEGGLSAQGRHFAEAYGETRMRRGVLRR